MLFFRLTMCFICKAQEAGGAVTWPGEGALRQWRAFSMNESGMQANAAPAQKAGALGKFL